MFDKKSMSQRGIRIEDSQWERCEEIAAVQEEITGKRVFVSDVIRYAISEYLKNLESEDKQDAEEKQDEAEVSNEAEAESGWRT